MDLFEKIELFEKMANQLNGSANKINTTTILNNEAAGKNTIKIRANILKETLKY